MKKSLPFAILAALVAATFEMRAGAGAEPSAPPAAPPAPVAYSRAALLERPPFAGSIHASKNDPGNPLELRGFYGGNPILQVSLARTGTKESAWIAVGDKSARWFVESADVDEGTAEVDFEGRRLHLALPGPE